MYSVIVLAALSANGPDAVSFGHRNAGCVGTQAGCTSAQAGCVGRSAGCHGLFGRGVVHRVLHRPLLRRNAGCVGCQGGQASAPVKQPVPQPMPKSAADCPTGNCPTQLTAIVTVTCDGDALEEVNTARARRGLRPFLRDGLLVQAAQRCAEFRAANRIAGHTANDFQFVPAGTQAVAAGSGALEPSWGWGTCCTHEDWTYAGAAVVMGPDGKRYMQLFVR